MYYFCDRLICSQPTFTKILSLPFLIFICQFYIYNYTLKVAKPLFCRISFVLFLWLNTTCNICCFYGSTQHITQFVLLLWLNTTHKICVLFMAQHNTLTFVMFYGLTHNICVLFMAQHNTQHLCCLYASTQEVTFVLFFMAQYNT